MSKNDRLKKYIKKKYYKSDKKVITIHVEKESELYNSLDNMKDTLADNVTEYLERSVETLLPLNKIQIKIDCKEKVDIENFQKCLEIHYGIENLNYDRIERLVRRKRIFLLLVALGVLGTFLIDTTKIMELRNFVLTLAAWEYIDMSLYKDENEEIRAYTCEMLERAKVIE